MNTKSLFATILSEGEKILKREDMDLVFELLSHNEKGIAIEFVCDKLAENNSVLSESLGNKLQFVSTRLNLNPIKTWEGLIVEDMESHQLKRIFREGIVLDSTFETIFQESCEFLSPEQVKWIRGPRNGVVALMA